MGIVVDAPDWEPRPSGERGRPAKYPWDEWQNGQRWIIASGIDFNLSAERFLPQIYTRARSTNMQVRTQLRSRIGEIEFQFFPEVPNKREDA